MSRGIKIESSGSKKLLGLISKLTFENLWIGNSANEKEEIPVRDIITGTGTLTGGEYPVFDDRLTTNSYAIVTPLDTGLLNGKIYSIPNNATITIKSTDINDTVRFGFIIVI